jgi:DNA repair exonuclease SbcCD ATPase subunit
MLKIKNLSVKNFMSVGNATQAIDFDRNDLTLVLGENLDLGGDDQGARNGTGKTTIINALSYALFGQALTNIKKDNLINKTNSKHMLVTINFDIDGQSYRIERGRKPNVLKFFIGDTEQESKDDNSQGDSRETQHEIENLLDMSHDMFKHIVALNTYTEPFLSLKANDQRTLIEQLLGITLLSEKAELLKEQNKKTKDEIQSEEFRIKAVSDANKRIQDQIDSLTRRQTLWLKKHQEDIDNLQTAYNQLAELDIEKELFNHKLLSDYNTKTKQTIDLATLIKRCEQDENRYTKDINKLKNDITALENHTCHSCGQAFHNKKQEELLKEKKQALQTTALDALVNNTQLLENQNLLKQLGDPGEKPNTFYKNEIDAFEHRSSMASLLTQITNKQNEHDPYAEQIEEMKTSAVQEISYDTLNVLTNIKDHQEFLLKLLTNKDSFIRKKIIDQNLSYLNVRLAYYLDKIGLPHTVRFQNDLTVDIQELGRELDFDNLSRGERNRLILSLSWAFRDVWESLYNPINLLFIDELVDSGMDSSGVENSLAILKKMSRDGNRSVWLVSHKDELAGRVGNILTVVKENGFTSYNTDIHMV